MVALPYIPNSEILVSVEELLDVDPKVWAIDKYNMGLLPVPPVMVRVKPESGAPQPQYPLSISQMDSLKIKIDLYLQIGVLIPTQSPYNTLLYPVAKMSKGKEMTYSS